GGDRGAAQGLLEVYVPFARGEPREAVVVILIEEVGPQRDRSHLPLEAVAQAEGRIAAGAGVEVVVEAQGRIQDAVARGLEVELLRGNPPLPVRIPEIRVPGGEGELLRLPFMEEGEIELVRDAEVQIVVHPE